MGNKMIFIKDLAGERLACFFSKVINDGSLFSFDSM